MPLSPVNIIGDVTHTLELLLDDLTPSLVSPADLTLGENESARINIFLYQALENPFGKNRNWRTRPAGDQEYPPLALSLYYLLTPYAIDELTAHHVLGDAMRILHDNAILRGAQLAESLRQVVAQLAIALMPLGLEELTRIWNSLQSAYQLSVAYEVRVVLVSSIQERTPSRVLTKVDIYSQI